jgi:hypothetical protein
MKTIAPVRPRSAARTMGQRSGKIGTFRICGTPEQGLSAQKKCRRARDLSQRSFAIKKTPRRGDGPGAAGAGWRSGGRPGGVTNSWASPCRVADSAMRTFPPGTGDASAPFMRRFDEGLAPCRFSSIARRYLLMGATVRTFAEKFAFGLACIGAVLLLYTLAFWIVHWSFPDFLQHPPSFG